MNLSMITGVLRRSSVPVRQTLSAALTSSESCLPHHFNLGANGVSVISLFALASPTNSVGIGVRDFHIRSEPSMVVPSEIAFQGYATVCEGSRDRIKKSKLRDSPDNAKPLSRKAITLQNEKAEESTSKIKGTKICIAIRSFDNPEKQAWSLPAHTRSVAMPDTRTLYTVLRSPHVDKKSREQFEMRFKKRFLVIKAESHELSKKLFWLKRYRILGAQYELQFHCKTRLDMTHVRDTINASTKAQ